jgi:hypothetical protein
MANYAFQFDGAMDTVCEGCGKAHEPSEIPNDSRCEDCYTMLTTPQVDDERAHVIDYEGIGQRQMQLA